MCPRSGNPALNPRVGIGRQSQKSEGFYMAKYDVVSYVPGNQTAAGMNNPFSTSNRRVTDNLQSIWWFTEGTGNTVYDRAPNTATTDLYLSPS